MLLQKLSLAYTTPNREVDSKFNSPPSGANFKKCVFCKNFLQISCFFAEKTMKMTISTSKWSAQHPNAGPNIQQMFLSQHHYLVSF